MERERKGKNLVIVILLITIVSLSVAFAATLQSVLNITGTATISSAKWNVYFSSATKTAGSTLTATSGPTVTAGNTISYTVVMEEGKYFEFDAVIKNDGSYDAKLDSLTLAGAEGYEDLITYSTSGLAQGGTIEAGEEETLTIKVSMGEVTNDNISLLENGKDLTLTVVANFVQAE